MENHLRQYNIRLLNFPEESKGKNPKDVLETQLKQVMDADVFSNRFAIDCVHRISMRVLLPRPLIAYILNFRDKENILKATRAIRT